MHVEALWAAATPLCPAVGAVVGFLLATEHTPLDSDREIHRGDSVDEPWGNPEPTQNTRSPVPDGSGSRQIGHSRETTRRR